MIRGITFGAWDLLHAGHILFFYECRKYCDELAVGLHIDPSVENFKKNKPIQSVYERFVQLGGCQYINYIIPYEIEKELKYILNTNEYKKYFVGSDHNLDEVTGRDICKELKIDIKFINRYHDYSTSSLRYKIKQE